MRSAWWTSAAASAICALLLFGTSAHADGPSRGPYMWSGFYVGIDGGAGWGQHDRDTGAFQNSYSSSGGLIGGHIGYDMPVSHNLFFGVVGTGAWANIKGDDGGTGGTVDETRINSLWTLRARLGLSISNTWLVYGTAGWGWADVDHHTIGGAPATTSHTLDGFVVGGGWEYVMSKQWSLKIEYLHYDLGSYAAAPAGLAPFQVDNKLDTVTAGLSYRF